MGLGQRGTVNAGVHDCLAPGQRGNLSDGIYVGESQPGNQFLGISAREPLRGKLKVGISVWECLHGHLFMES